MKEFTVDYKGKKYAIHAETAYDAFLKFSNRIFSEDSRIFECCVDMVDRATRGNEWVVSHTIGDDEEHRIFVERASTEAK